MIIFIVLSKYEWIKIESYKKGFREEDLKKIAHL